MARILFIGLPFYAYTERIADSLRRKGHDVTYRPIEKRTFVDKSFKKLAPAWHEQVRDAYHRGIVEAANGTRYDHVVFLQTHHVSQENMSALKDDHREAKFSLYNWDSLTTHDYAPYLKYFDTALTFDKDDAAKLGIGYLPLFALPEYFRARTDAPKTYDLYFVGTVATMSRYDAVAALHKFCASEGIRLKMHLQCSLPIYASLRGKGLRLEGISLSALAPGDVIALLEKSEAVFDVPNHRQTGYTMRFIENMCANKKIVTSNENIEAEPFFSDDRFLVVRDLDFGKIAQFLRRPLTSKASFDAFSLDNWTEELIRR